MQQSINKYNAEYKRKLETEMRKFNRHDEAGDGPETASELTSATKVTRMSGKSGGIMKKGTMSRASSPDREKSVMVGVEDMDTNLQLTRGGQP